MVRKNKIIHGDCGEILKNKTLFPDESIDLVITSPPYADKRKNIYNTYTNDEYVEWFLEISSELKRVLKPQGSFILNIKENVKKFERQTYTYELVLAMKKQGWMWIEEYCWNKRTSFPGKWKARFRDGWERCYHFAKQSDLIFNHDAVLVPIGDWAKVRFKDGKINEHDKNTYLSKTGSGFKRKVENWKDKKMVHPSNVLDIVSVTSNLNHSAAFPVELPTWFIKLLTNKNDIVLDPFMGSGSSAIAALELNRSYVGIEIDKDFIDIANTRMVMDSIFKSRKSLYEKNITELKKYDNKSCIYGFFVKNSKALKAYSKSRKLLYVGITTRGLFQRDINEHLKSGKTPNSSFRRSIGAILKKDLNLQVMNRKLKNPKYDKFKFTKESEIELTDWIMKNCHFGFWHSKEDLTKKELIYIESKISELYRPSLNLDAKTKKYNKMAKQLSGLRKICSDEWKNKNGVR